jgi:hypothetical protein
MNVQILLMPVWKIFRAASLCFVALLSLSVGTAVVAQSAGGWTIVISPNPGSSATRLSGVAAVSANDIWAVGHYLPNGGSAFENLAMHFDGAQWAVVPRDRAATCLCPPIMMATAGQTSLSGVHPKGLGIFSGAATAAL